MNFLEDPDSSDGSVPPVLALSHSHATPTTGDAARHGIPHDRTATTEVTVGPTRATSSRAPGTVALSCEECHKVPAAVNDQAASTATTEITLGALAGIGGRSPASTGAPPPASACTAMGSAV